MIITVAGLPGAGKSTVANIIANKLGLEYYNMGKLFRHAAKERGMTLVDYLEYGKTHPTVDTDMDEYQKQLGTEKDNFVFDSRLGWYFIPHSIKILVTVDPTIGAQRVYDELQQSNQRNEDSNLDSVAAVELSHQTRVASDRSRYQALYEIDPYAVENFDIVLDTSDLDKAQVAAVILEKLAPFLANK